MCSFCSLCIFLFQLKWLHVLTGPACTCVNACCDFHSVSDSVNIPTLVCCEHLQLLSLSWVSPSSPFLLLALSVFLLLLFLWFKHRTGEKKTNEHREREVEKRQRRARDDQEQCEKARGWQQNLEENFILFFIYFLKGRDLIKCKHSLFYLSGVKLTRPY